MRVKAKDKLARLKKSKSKPKREERKPQRQKERKVPKHEPKKLKLKKPVRKLGEKKTAATRLLKLPQFPDARSPREPSPLMQFIESCGEEVTYLDAIHEFQQNWCDHPRSEQVLQSLHSSLDPENMSYTRRCGGCGATKELKGRPPSWLK